MARPRQQGPTAHRIFNLDAEDNSPSPSINVVDTYTIDSEDEVEELEYYIIPDDELLAPEHIDDAAPNRTTYTLPPEDIIADLESYKFNGLTLLAGGRMTVSFNHNGQEEYLTILYIRQDRILSEVVTLIGNRFIKNDSPDLGHILDTTHKDEVCWIATYHPGKELGYLCEIPINAVIEKRQIDMTNAPAPRGSSGAWLIHEDLACRWKAIIHFSNGNPNRSKPTQAIVRKLQAAECGARSHVPDDELQRHWRGETIKGGSMTGLQQSEYARLQAESVNQQRYTGALPTFPIYPNLPINLIPTAPPAPTTQPSLPARPTLGSMLPARPNLPARSNLPARPSLPIHSSQASTTQSQQNTTIQIDSDDDIMEITSSSMNNQSVAHLTADVQRVELDEHRPSPNLHDIPHARQIHTIARMKQRYTFGDAFCGAGGVSRGAEMAGLSIAFGFDRGKDQCHTWETNFPYGTVYHCDVSAFLGAEIDAKVDILHLSPPCQPYSPANTRPNEKKDEANIAACFAISDLIDKCKPRLVTMENTAGLLERKPEWFHRYVNLITTREYSVRWSVVDMASYGVPQRRQRLIIIAAGPGEVLPSFPPFTHARVPTLGLARWVSINTALSRIPPGCPDHDVVQAQLRGHGAKPAPDGHSVAKCVTCNGGENEKHPNGNRGYTNREYATLQTFPLYHEFRPQGPRTITTIRSQIGNAVPPRFAKVLFGWLKKSLEEADQMQGPDVMELD